jgi:hypothetical protein
VNRRTFLRAAAAAIAVAPVAALCGPTQILPDTSGAITPERVAKVMGIPVRVISAWPADAITLADLREAHWRVLERYGIYLR